MVIGVGGDMPGANNLVPLWRCYFFKLHERVLEGVRGIASLHRIVVFLKILALGSSYATGPRVQINYVKSPIPSLVG